MPSAATAEERALVPSGQQTATFTSKDFDNIMGQTGAIFVLDVTAISASNVSLSVQVKDPASGKYITIATTATLAAPGTKSLLIYPNTPTTGTGFDQSVPAPLPIAMTLPLGKKAGIPVTKSSVTAGGWYSKPLSGVWIETSKFPVSGPSVL